MSNHVGGRTVSKLHNSNVFKNVSIINGDGFKLHLKNFFLYSELNIPGYEFIIKANGEDAGIFTVLIEKDFNKISTIGNVGINLNRKFWGMNLPFKVTKASFPLFQSHEQSTILITFNEGNRAIEQACKNLSATYIDSLKSDDGVSKKRCVVNAISF